MPLSTHATDTFGNTLSERHTMFRIRSPLCSPLNSLIAVTTVEQSLCQRLGLVGSHDDGSP